MLELLTARGKIFVKWDYSFDINGTQAMYVNQINVLCYETYDILMN